MTIEQLTAASAVSAADSTQGTSTTKKDPLGQDAFMQLLLTQLQNQDPTQPQADGEFLAQLAQFSQLEQMQKMNEKLDALVAVFSAITPTTSTSAATATSSSTARSNSTTESSTTSSATSRA